MSHFSLLEAIPFPVALWRVESDDPGDTRLIYCNKLSREMPGAVHRHLGKKVHEFIPNTVDLPPEYNTPEASLRVAKTGTPEVFHKLPFQDPDSDLPPMIYNIHITRWEKDHVLFTYAQENAIGEDSKKLFETERKLRTLTHLPGHVITLDNDCRILDINRVAEGYSLDDLLGIHHWESTGVEESDQIVYRKWHEYLALPEGEKQKAFEVKGLPEGTWYRLWYRRLDKRTTIGTVLDVTDEIRAREALEQANETLSRTNSHLQQFTYVASHDLQEPLRTITSFVQVLEEDLGPTFDEEHAEYLSYIKTASHRLSDLVSGLLDFSRIDTKGVKFEERDLTHIAQAASRDIGKASYQIGSLGVLPVDPEQMHRVFTNLFSNSVKYAQPNVDPVIHVDAVESKDENEVIISVRDNGLGIDPEYHEMIFVPFKRLHTQHEIEGTGIGLAIVQKIMDRHGGSIWVESDGKSGSTFRFVLPRG